MIKENKFGRILRAVSPNYIKESTKKNTVYKWIFAERAYEFNESYITGYNKGLTGSGCLSKYTSPEYKMLVAKTRSTDKAERYDGLCAFYERQGYRKGLQKRIEIEKSGKDINSFNIDKHIKNMRDVNYNKLFKQIKRHRINVGIIPRTSVMKNYNKGK